MTPTGLEQVERSSPSSPVPQVSLPEKMYLAMAHCYFGGGPRFRETGGGTIQMPSRGSPELPPSDEEVGKLPSITRPVTISRPLPGRPMGVATQEFPDPPRK